MNRAELRDLRLSVRRAIPAIQQIRTQVTKEGRLLDDIVNTARGLNWRKEYVDGKHLYRNGNKEFFDLFFGLSHLEHDEQLKHVYDRTDIELLNEYRGKTGKRHTYGELCENTDLFTKEHAEHERKNGREPQTLKFFEMGIIGDQPLVLCTRKRASFCPNVDPRTGWCEECKSYHALSGYYYSTGWGLDLTDYPDQYEDIDNWKNVEKIEPGVYWVKPAPEKREETKIFIESRLQ